MKHFFPTAILLGAITLVGATCAPSTNVNTATQTAVQAAGGGVYRAYDAAAVTQAATTGDAVLFFHAPWCPTCAALDRSITASVATIPEGITIFKTDYDSSQELKEIYGVTYQHTLVHVDAEGDIITKWSGGNTLQSILDRVE